MLEGSATRGWLVCLKPNPRATLRLFCFPYAGGGLPAFKGWAKALPISVEIWVVVLPGRGAFIRQPPFRSMGQLVGSLKGAFSNHHQTPFSFLGHSLGALVSFEVVRALRKENKPLPACLFVSGCGPPQLPDLSEPLHDLPDDEFLEAIRRLNGTPPEVLENQELIRLFLPAIRADFEVAETYVYQEEPPLDCPISAFGGLQDPLVTREGLLAWRYQSTGRFSLQMFPGDHFFIHNNGSGFLGYFSAKLDQLTKSLEGVSQ
jgi:medium-chain acyl-[acyl-carrier-protein] hydrolase